MDAVQPAMHGRDHCPGGTDPIPCFPAIQIFRAANNQTTTVPGTSRITVDFEEWQVSAPASVPVAFTPLDTALVAADPGDVVRRVQLELEGRYTFLFGAVRGSAISGTLEIAMHDGDDTWGFPDCVYHGDEDGGLGIGFATLSLSRIYPIYDPFGGVNDIPQISITLAQNGGSSEAFGPCTLEIHYESTPIYWPEVGT